MQGIADQVYKYWDAHASRLNVDGKQWGSKEFFAHIKLEHDKMYAGANEILNLDSLKGQPLLELGCGIGLDTIEFARHGAEVTAIDLSPTCLDLAKRFLAHHHLDATLEMANAEELPYPPNRFDIVVARGILMYTVNDLRIVDEILRVLKPGGKANILLHNRLSWYVLLAKLSGTNLFNEFEDPPVDRLYSVAEAQTMFGRFSSSQIGFDRFPSTITNRRGLAARLYNTVLVPITALVPISFLRPFGYYIIIEATK